MKDKIIKRAKETILIESNAVKEQAKHINGEFIKAVDAVADCMGRIAVMGVGKSGLIGRKISATMSSLGLPALFLHPAECLHGDMGMLMPNDIVIMLSYSGESSEIKKVIPHIKHFGIKIIVMTGKINSKSWKMADIIINSKIHKEACPFNLAPTSSTTAMLALGDALSLCASEKKGFGKEVFARFHPEGGLGKKLNVKVQDIMRKGKDNPVIGENSKVDKALIVMTKTKVGATSVVNRFGKIVGFFTDGDLRRKLQTDKFILNRKIKDVMTKSPMSISPDSLAHDAAKMLKGRSIDNIPVVDKNNRPIGILDEGDLISEGIV